MGARRAHGTRGSGPNASRLLLLTVITALVASSCGELGGPTSPATGSARPTSSAASGATSTAPAPSDDAWGSLTLPPLAPIASLEATKHGTTTVAADTAFELTSLDGTPVGELAERLDVTPEIGLRADAPNGDSITLRPAERLRAGQLYRFALRRQDGSIARTWAVTAATELRIIGSIPGDESSEVPTNTGIEITLDQTGVTVGDFEKHFTIEPKVSGAFEVHGRSVVFVPNDPLETLTVYTITISQGLPLPGTGQTLTADWVIRFETSGSSARRDVLSIEDLLIDTAVADAPVIAMDVYDRNDDGQVEVPTSLPVTVHRFGTIDAAMAAWTTLALDPDWAYSSGSPIDTGPLTRVLAADLPTEPLVGQEEDESSGQILVRLPAPLERGWYVLTATFEGRSQQVLLQIANISAFAMVNDDQTVVWVNSVGSGRPIEGAAVSVAGASLGTTDEDGLRVAATPSAALNVPEGAGTFVVVRAEGRALFVPIGSTYVCGKCGITEGPGEGIADVDDWWHTLALDRQRFRPTDQANVWGVVKARSGGVVPKQVEIALEAYDDWSSASPAIVVTKATLVSTGMFTAELPFKDLPVGDYNIVLRADGDVFATEYVRIEPIVKPAFAIDVTTDERAVLSGTSVAVTAAAAFYEGTPVSGVELRLGGSQWQDEETPEDTKGAEARTGVDGRATASLPLALGVACNDEGEDCGGDQGQWEWVWVGARPTLPEEADITGSTYVAVFRSNALLETEALVDDDRLVMTGTLSDVDWARMAAADPGDWDIDPSGDPRAGATVRLKIREYIPVRRRVGTRYDPITKTTAPIYEYDQRAVELGTKTATTRSDGTFRTTLEVAGGNHDYRVWATYTDEGDRQIQAEAYASAPEPVDASQRARLQTPDAEEGGTYAIGDEIEVTMVGGHPKASADRYLYVVSSRGLRTVTVQNGPTFTTTFRSAWVPNASIRGVRFNGSAYEGAESAFTADLDHADRELRVTVTPDAKRYEPGGSVTLTVRTAEADGDPVVASVVVRAIDEKLYAIGAAGEVDLLDALYASVGDGMVTMGWSHGSRTSGGEGGDTGGGGDGGQERSDFRDWALFRLVTTNAEGRATVTFDLPDDLTSWRVSTSALDADVNAGGTSTKVPVGLPFFAEATLAPEYLTGDVPVLRVRGFGADLDTGDEVTFTVSSTTLGLSGTTVTAKAFKAASVTLPALPAGTHRIRIVATTGTGATRLEDALVRTIKVVESRTTQTMRASGPLIAGFDLAGGATGFTRLVLADGGRGRVIPTLLSMTETSTGRGDQALASAVSRAVLRDVFDLPADLIGGDDAIDPTVFQQNGGFALLPYASPDMELSALAALADDPTVDRARLVSYLNETLYEDSEGTAPTRERRIVALAGLAAADEPALAEIREAAAATDLTPFERSWLALAALAAGDEDLAGSLERALLADEGERLGPWVRLSLSDAETSITTTALLAIVAAGIGDPLAADMDAYLGANPPEDTLVDLQRALAGRYTAERTPGVDAVASLTVGDSTRRIAIDAGSAVWLTFTPDQIATANLAPVSGSIVVSTEWQSPLDPGSLEPHGVTTFTRTVTPAGTIGLEDVVIVEYAVDLDEDGDKGCWAVTDFVPSGLVPIAGEPRLWFDDEGISTGTEGPWQVAGQRVGFCTSEDTIHPVRELRYAARVVTPGTYRWEPAVIQSTVIPEWGAVLPGTVVEVASQ